MNDAGSNHQLVRLAETGRRRLDFTIDGIHAEALEGDTILTAILTQQRALRRFEFADGARAGFCLMGACQDCWVRLADATPVRACTTLVAPGMAIVTGLAA